MLDYRKKNGSLIFKPNCVGAELELRSWIYAQRRLLRMKKMPRRRKAILRAAKFQWKRGVIHDDQWDEMYSQLVAFYETNGHLIVTAKKNTLGTWICRQRAHRRRGKLSQDRIDRLNKLPFSWSGIDVELEALQEHGWDDAPINFYFREWQAKLKGLMEFKERFGHMEVGRGYNETLNVWVFRQRKQYAMGTLREERVARLNSVGFPWEMKPRKGKKLNSRSSEDGKAMPEEHGFPSGQHDPLPSSPSPTPTTRKRKADEYEDEVETRKGGKPTSERDSRKARRDNNACSTLLAVRSTRNRPKVSSPETVTCKASIAEKPVSTPPRHVSTSEPTKASGETEHVSALLAVRSVRDGPIRKANTRQSVTTRARTEIRESPPKELVPPPTPAPDHVYPIGTQLLNFFPGHGWYKGTVHAVDKHKYTVSYEDGDVEEFPIEGPTLDALVELAKSNPAMGLEDSARATPKASDTSAPICACNQGHAGGLKGLQDTSKEVGTTNEIALRTGIDLSEEECNVTDDKVTSDVLECDALVKGIVNDNLVSSQTKSSEFEIMLARANKIATVAQAELKSVSSLLRQQERRCYQNEKLIDKLRAQIVDLEQSQFVTGSVAQKVLSRLQGKLKSEGSIAVKNSVVH